MEGATTELSDVNERSQRRAGFVGKHPRLRSGHPKKNRSAFRLRQYDTRGGHPGDTLPLRPRLVNQRDSTSCVGDQLTSVLRSTPLGHYRKSIEDNQSSIETSTTSGMRRSGLRLRSRELNGGPISSLRRSASSRCSPDGTVAAARTEPGTPIAISAMRLFMSHLALYAAHSRKDVSATSISRRSAHRRRSLQPIGGPAS